MRQTRHILSTVCPAWLRGEQAKSFLNEGIFTIYDIDTKLWWDALLSRWPSFAPVDALPYLAADKKIIVGPYEAEAATRARIRGWLNEAVLAGLPMGLLIALQAYAAPTYPRIRIITKRSTYYTLEAGAVPRLLGLLGAVPLPPCPYELGAKWPIENTASPIDRLRCSGLYTRETGVEVDWDSTSNPERAACWWDAIVVIYGAYTAQGNYDESTPVYDDPLESVGLHEPYGTFTAQWYLSEQRRSAKSVLRAIIWTADDSQFDPSTGLSSGLCGWSGALDAGVLRPTRDPSWRVIHEYPR